MRNALAILLIVAAVASQLSAQTGQDERLEQTRIQLERARQDAERILNSQADLYQQLESVDKELELSSRLLRQIRKQAQETSAAISATADT
ncbi:MAG: hypothetical protein WBP29_04310, partial [Candidatus Zixiibacteriota bacterium]